MTGHADPVGEPEAAPEGAPSSTGTLMVPALLSTTAARTYGEVASGPHWPPATTACTGSAISQANIPAVLSAMIGGRESWPLPIGMVHEPDIAFS